MGMILIERFRESGDGEGTGPFDKVLSHCLSSGSFSDLAVHHIASIWASIFCCLLSHFQAFCQLECCNNAANMKSNTTTSLLSTLPTLLHCYIPASLGRACYIACGPVITHCFELDFKLSAREAIQDSSWPRENALTLTAAE